MADQMNTTETRRDEINIDLDGSIDGAIAELKRLKKLHPDGEISLENEYEYGESYARLKLSFTRPAEPIEIELAAWEAKRRSFDEMRQAAAAFKREGAEYPRAAEMAALEAELGSFADTFGSLTIANGDVVIWDHRGGRMRDGTWRFKALAFDMLEQFRQQAAETPTP